GLIQLCQQLFQALTMVRQGLTEGGETGLLRLTEALHAGEGEPLKQLAVGLDGAAEEVTDGNDQQRGGFPRGARGRPRRQQARQGGKTGATRLGGPLLHGLPFRVEKGFGAGEAREGARLTGQSRRIERTTREVTRLPRPPQVLKALPPELRAVLGERRGL